MSDIEFVKFGASFGVVVLGALLMKGLIFLLNGKVANISKSLEMLLVIAVPAIFAAMISNNLIGLFARVFNLVE
ncbi:hypothetical protein [Pseudomonas sp. NMS19W]|uniref:hypothetical protein n=1 Tax=Pseudomonas sp. NMS19W TaxID=3079768 RepID=UPI003F65EE73